MERTGGESEPRTLRLVLEYDGTRYAGWQRQRRGPTVQAVVEEAVERITGERAGVVASGRTDAGVHALGQVAAVRLHSTMPPQRLMLALNAVLPEDVSVVEADEAPPGFHPRFDAVSKTYLYRVLNALPRPALERGRVWHVPTPLDEEAMTAALRAFVGEHDFRPFARSGSGVKSTVRRVLRVELRRRPRGMMELEIEATGFLRGMARQMVGTVINVGRGKLEPGQVAEILRTGRRSKWVVSAPPHGLYLKEVRY